MLVHRGDRGEDERGVLAVGLDVVDKRNDLAGLLISSLESEPSGRLGERQGEAEDNDARTPVVMLRSALTRSMGLFNIPRQTPVPRGGSLCLGKAKGEP